MRAVITGGGSGGHIYPALAIADGIKKMDPDSEILYIGNDLGLEKDIVPGTGYDFRMVDARWFEKTAIGIIKTCFVTRRGSNQALRMMKEFKPDVVIGTGGFVCVPVINAGHRYGVPCYIHEQNAFPGVANRFLERYVDKIFLGFDAAGRYFKDSSKLVSCGNPVRSIFFNVDRAEARKKLDLSDDRFVVLSFAGSQGANRMNDVVYEAMKKINQDDDGKLLIFVTGTMHYQTVMDRLEEEGVELTDNVRIIPYIDDMQDYLAASDLVISRAGALSVAEICVLGKASILVPSPNVPGNHQFFNAKAVVDRGGAVMIEEKDFIPELLLKEIDKLRGDEKAVSEMEEAALKCAPHDAVDIVTGIVSKG